MNSPKSHFAFRPTKSHWTLLAVFTFLSVLESGRGVESTVDWGDLGQKPKPLLHRPKILPCGTRKTLNPGEEVYIESPNFSNKMNYPNSVTCQWNFKLSGCRLAIACPNFKLSDFLCFDYLEVRDGNGNVNRFCGTKGPSQMDLNKEVNITFRSSAFFSNIGFRCSLVCDESIYLTDPDLVKPQEPPTNCSCGVSSYGNKIVNGVPVPIGEFPWMAGLTRPGSNRPFCGASLINSRYVLTAAHCVTGRTPYNLEVILNENAPVGEESAATIRRAVEAIIPHRMYTARLDYDAALIRLQEPIDLLHEPVLPVCLPTFEDLNTTYADTNATVAGWGVTTENGPQSELLLQANVTVISNEDCDRKYDSSVTSRMLCAAGPGRDACQGDSGGPLFYLSDEMLKKYTQIGIVSWGHGCARPEKPGVYSRVTEFLQWILLNTADGSYCSK